MPRLIDDGMKSEVGDAYSGIPRDASREGYQRVSSEGVCIPEDDGRRGDASRSRGEMPIARVRTEGMHPDGHITG
jgi:hypothetical protein